MKGISLLFLVLFSSVIFAETESAFPVIAEKSFPPITWLSKGTTDIVNIENANSHKLIVQIAVNKIITVEGAAKDTVSAGINIKNCGSTTHLEAGSSVICSSSNASYPITITSDSETKLAMGTYEVKIAE